MTSPRLEGCSAPSSIRHQLRHSTASLHARVDLHLTEVLQAPDGYGRFLAISAAAILPLERALEQANVTAILPDWGDRSRSAALQADLEALSTAVPPARPTAGEMDLRGEAFQFGLLYVLEGSRLGAAAILRALHAAPHGTYRYATRYLSHGHGEQLWKSFLHRLEASSATRRDPHRAVAGAHAAFGMFLPTDNHNC